jgi:predicted transcriptional regulator
LNPTNKNNISVSFARLSQEAWQGEKVDWAAQFHAKLKSETITLHQQQFKAKTKVLKSPLGPHITLILHEAGVLDK